MTGDCNRRAGIRPIRPTYYLSWCAKCAGIAKRAARDWRAARRLAAVLLGLTFVGALRADLQWQMQRLRLEPPAGAVEARGEFVFFNRGAEPIRVLDARSSCDCTVLPMARSEIPPGEQGRIPVVYHVGTRQGRQSVSIEVTTSEPAARKYELTLEVMIQDFITFAPRVLYWSLGDQPAAKRLQVGLIPGFRFLEAASASPDFVVKVDEASAETVQLQVSPRDTWAKRVGMIKVRVAKEGQAAVEVIATVRVQ